MPDPTFVRETRLNLDDAAKRIQTHTLILFIINVHIIAGLALIPFFLLLQFSSYYEAIPVYILLVFLGIMQAAFKSFRIWTTIKQDKEEQMVYLYKNRVAGRHPEAPFFYKTYWIELDMPFEDYDKVHVAKEAYERFTEGASILLVIGKHSKYPLMVISPTSLGD